MLDYFNKSIGKKIIIKVDDDSLKSRIKKLKQLYRKLLLKDFIPDIEDEQDQYCQLLLEISYFLEKNNLFCVVYYDSLNKRIVFVRVSNNEEY
jgi:hypothetical protein